MIPVAYCRETGQTIRLTQEDLVRSVHSIGTPGTGKSSFAKIFVCGAVDNDIPFTLIEPEGELFRYAVRECGRGWDEDKNIGRARKTVIIEPTYGELFVPLNVFDVPPGVQPFSRADTLVAAFKRAWHDSWGPRLQDFLLNAFLLAIELKLSLYEVLLLITYPDYRHGLAKASQNPHVRGYFLEHLKGIKSYELRSWTEAVRNKIQPFVINPYILPSVSQDRCFDFFREIELGKTILVHVSQEGLKESASLYGLLLTTLFQEAAARRKENQSKLHVLVIDEFQTFVSPLIIDLLSRARRRGIGCILMHQSLVQPPFDRDKGFIDSILALTHTSVIFRCGRQDAQRLAPEMFEISGERVKIRKKHPIWGSHGPAQFWSTFEQLEHFSWLLQDQQPKECYISKATRGIETHEAVMFEVPDESVDEKRIRDFASLSRSMYCRHVLYAEEDIKDRETRLWNDYGVKPPVQLEKVQEERDA